MKQVKGKEGSSMAQKKPVTQGDQITVGNISNSTAAIGRNAKASSSIGLDGDQLAKLFAGVYQKIETRPESQDVGKEEITGTVKNIETEVKKGEAANPKKVERWLKTLAGMAPDILEVTIATLTDPLAGIATVIRKIAEKVKAELAKPQATA
jgi:hypothetical protein